MTELLRLKSLDPEWDWSGCAVIAREWKYLEPVRAFCEVHAIPVHMGNEEMPRFCLLRETRALVGWLRGRDTRLVDLDDLREWIEALPHGAWTELLQEAVDDHALETGGAAVPVDHFVEWLAEWGRDVGRRRMEHAESVARRRGYGHVNPYPHERMTENIAMCERIGDVEVDRRTEHGFPRVYMRMRL